jgi:BA14K-like protein
MINPKVMSTAAATALVLSVAAPTAGFAEYKGNNGGGVRANAGYRPAPPSGFTRPGPAVVAAPAVGGYRGGSPMVQPGGGGAVYRGGYNGGYREGGYRGGGYRDGGYRYGGYRDHDRDRDRGGAFVAGAVAGAIIGGAVASPGYGYYGGPGVYYAPGYYSDQYDDGGPAVAAAPVGDDAVAYCIQTYPSYDPQSGTYLGNDGYQHPCP